jgi:hypothetical protein
MLHPETGKRGASADKKRPVRSDFTVSQQAARGVIETACHRLLSAMGGARHIQRP